MYFNSLINMRKNIFNSEMKSTQKRKVKKLQNSPYAISEDQVLGKGSFAVIKRAFNLDNPTEQLAAKVISVRDQQNAITIKSELVMLKELPHHPNLVNCMKVQISTQRNFYIIMEYCNQGNLEKFIYDRKNDLDEDKIWFFLKQFCEGYKVLYDKSIVHRDIKPQNILIHNGNFKIADFGLAKSIIDVQILQNMSSKGTPLYMAPELHLEKEGCSKVDVFSLGIILYRMAFRGRFPFFEQGRTYHSINDYFKELMIKKLIFPQKHHRSKQLVHLITQMLQKDKQERLGWKQIFDIEKIKRAVRNERKKQIVSMEQFRKSMIVVVNNSIADVKVIETQQREGGNDDSPSTKEENFIFIEQAFNKQERSKLEKKLYATKILYTFIDITNRRIIKTLDKHKEQLHEYISKQLSKIVLEGMYFSLFIIQSLQQISGDWQAIAKGQLLNFEDIFENDKQILCQKLKQNEKEQKRYVIGTYQDFLYQFLTEYIDFPGELKKNLNVIIGFLLDLYDLVLKSDERQELDEEDKGNALSMQEAGVQKFQNYLIEMEQITQKKIKERMKKMGLLFI